MKNGFHGSKRGWSASTCTTFLTDRHAPGKGNANWEMVAKYLPPGIVEVCEIGEWNDEEQMQGVVEFLQKKWIVG